MGRSNYKLTDEQKQILNDFTDDIIKEIKYEIYREYKCLDVYDSEGKFERNKFTAIVWYIADKLSSY